MIPVMRARTRSGTACESTDRAAARLKLAHTQVRFTQLVPDESSLTLPTELNEFVPTRNLYLPLVALSIS